MRRALLVATLLVAVAATVALAADAAAKAPPPAQAAPLAPRAPAPAAGPVPAATVPPPPPAVAPPASPPNACCAEVEASGFQRAPGVPVVIIRTPAGGPITRNKTAATLCTCGAADIGVPAFDGAPITDWAGPIELRVRGGTNTRKGAGEGRGERDGEAQGPPPVAPRKPSSLTAAAHPRTHPAPPTHTEMYNTILQYAATLPKAAAEGGANGTAATPAPAAPHPPPTHLLGLAGSPVLFMGQVNDTAGLKESLGRDLARAMGWAGPGAPPLPPAALASPYATWAAPAGPLGWVPRTVSVELFIVGGGAALGATPTQYRGLYLASEHVSKGKGKLDLSAPAPPGAPARPPSPLSCTARRTRRRRPSWGG